MRSIGDIKKGEKLTGILISDIRPNVGRPKINDEQTPARFPAGTLAKIDSVLDKGEKRSDLIREAVDREIKRRSRKADKEAE